MNINVVHHWWSSTRVRITINTLKLLNNTTFPESKSSLDFTLILSLTFPRRDCCFMTCITNYFSLL